MCGLSLALCSPSCRPPDKSVYVKIIFLISQPKHNVVGTQKNRLDETVLLSTQKHMFRLLGQSLRKFPRLYRTAGLVDWKNLPDQPGFHQTDTI